MEVRKLVVTMENKPGVLSRIAALFHKKNFNIETIHAEPTENKDITVMEVGILADDYIEDLAIEALDKFEEVLEIKKG